MHACIHTHIHTYIVTVDMYGKKLSPEDIASAKRRGGHDIVRTQSYEDDDDDVRDMKRNVSMYVCMYVCM